MARILVVKERLQTARERRRPESLKDQQVELPFVSIDRDPLIRMQEILRIVQIQESESELG